jgi:hypothetical protein
MNYHQGIINQISMEETSGMFKNEREQYFKSFYD